MSNGTVVAVAGHICLDIIPALREASSGLERLLVPGKLVDVGAATLSTGGAVPNTGLALHRLGVPVRLIGKVGTDPLGNVVRSLLDHVGEGLSRGLVTGPAPTSYTVVISPPGTDRIFLHCPGANDTFGPEDVGEPVLHEAGLLHFGYPPLMRRMYERGGEELAVLLQRGKAAGVTTSLDMARPDPDADAGRVDWAALIARVLPFTDVFLPSFDELLFMLDRPRLERIQARHGARIAAGAEPELLDELAARLLAAGAAVVGIKLGDRGIYLATTRSRERLALAGRARPAPDWLGRQLLAPCYCAHVVGTTGSGDCTIAGLLAGLVWHMSAEKALNMAVAVGACSVEQADATSGVPDWAVIEARQVAGWPRLDSAAPGPGWMLAPSGHWRGPHDGEDRA